MNSRRRVINMYHAINSNLLSFACQFKKRLLNIVWCLPLGTENALRRGISIAALHMVWHELRDQSGGGGEMAAACSRGASSSATISVLEEVASAQGMCRESLAEDFRGTKFFFFFF